MMRMEISRDYDNSGEEILRSERVRMANDFGLGEYGNGGDG
jgi:hypothetical protein